MKIRQVEVYNQKRVIYNKIKVIQELEQVNTSTAGNEYSSCIINLENIQLDEFKLLCSRLNEDDSNERVAISYNIIFI